MYKGQNQYHVVMEAAPQFGERPETLRDIYVRPPGGARLRFYGVDVGRSPDGRWWVLGDRTQAPSGAGYALENCLALSRFASASGVK